MPRTRRYFFDGVPYHILNRANRRQQIFTHSYDYECFISTLADALTKHPVQLFAFVVMPTHFHLVLRASPAVAISAFMDRFMNAHIRRYHRYRELWGTGHLYQGRFKDFGIQSDHHLLTVLRYVEANPLRARLVDRAEDWPWSSLTCKADKGGRPLLTESPVPRPYNWIELVNRRLPLPTESRIRTSVQRQVEYGDAEWLRVLEQRRNGDSQK